MNKRTKAGFVPVVTEVPDDRFSSSAPVSGEVGVTGDFKVDVSAEVLGVKGDVERYVKGNTLVKFEDRTRQALNNAVVFANENTQLAKFIRDTRADDLERNEIEMALVNIVHTADSANVAIRSQDGTLVEATVLTFGQGEVSVTYSSECKANLSGEDADIFFRSIPVDYDLENDEVFIASGSSSNPSDFKFLRAPGAF